jgi:F-type H+-transporting ATPase subunit b
MKIDWFTVIAQIINFLILVWLLKRFLYKPILNAVDAREKKISDQLLDAENKVADAKKKEEAFSKKNEDFDNQKKELMDKAVAETEVKKTKLLEEATTAAKTFRTNMEKASKEKQENEVREIAQKTQQEVFTMTRKALTDIASVGLEEQAVDTFIKRMKDLKKEEMKQFNEAFKSNTNVIMVRSAFELPVKQQHHVSSAVDEILGEKAKLQFKKDPGIISGIELSTNGYKLAWSFSEYINALEKSISETKKENHITKHKTNDAQDKKPEPEK